MSSYFHFLNERRVTLKKEQPELLMGPQTKVMTSEWKALDDKKRKKYEDLAAKDKLRYEKELKEAGLAKPGKVEKEEGAPKRP